jgi:hypothetical protein
MHRLITVGRPAIPAARIRIPAARLPRRLFPVQEPVQGRAAPGKLQDHQQKRHEQAQ